MLRLPYGRVPYPIELGDAPVTIVEAPPSPPEEDLATLLEHALDAPIDSPRLETLARHADRITVILSDHTRAEPRAAFIEAIRRRLPARATLTFAIATGTHGPSPLAPLGLDAVLQAVPLDRTLLVNHDGHRERDLVPLGTTRRGTPIVLHRCVVDTDLVIATGCIRPHYFAGFGAGAKAIFPGLGEAMAIRRNHELKTAPGARAGIVEGNPCRADLEEAATTPRVPRFLLNGVVAADEQIHAAVAGDVLTAFRAGAAVARHWFTVHAVPAPVVIASDALPVSASLYQAAKIAAAAAPLVLPGGRLIIVAACEDGIGPLDVVNEAIFRLGVLPRLASGVSLELVSSLPDDLVLQTLLRPLRRIEISQMTRTLVIPHASHLLVEAV